MLFLTIIGCRNKLKHQDKTVFTGFHLGDFRLIFMLNLDSKVFVRFYIHLARKGRELLVFLEGAILKFGRSVFRDF